MEGSVWSQVVDAVENVGLSSVFVFVGAPDRLMLIVESVSDNPVSFSKKVLESECGRIVQWSPKMPASAPVTPNTLTLNLPWGARRLVKYKQPSSALLAHQ